MAFKIAAVQRQQSLSPMSFLSPDSYGDIVLSQVGLKACLMRDGYSLNKWNYAFPTRPKAPTMLIAGGGVEGRNMFNFNRVWGLSYQKV